MQGISDQSCSIRARPRFPYSVLKLVAMVMVAAASAVLCAHCAIAAEVSCVTTWGGGILDYTGEADLNHFPSGRRPSGTTCREALLKGEIVSGDFNKVFSVVRANHPFLDRLLLWSPGGSVEEAMKIGRFVRKAMLITQAPTGMGLDDGSGDLISTYGMDQFCKGDACNCASACFLIWAAGIERDGWSVGLHRPSIETTSFGNLPPEKASQMYRSLLEEINAYLLEMEIPPSLTEAMTNTSSAGIRWLTIKEFNSLEEVPSIAVWISASCGGTTKSSVRWDDANDVRASVDRLEKVFQCESMKIDNSRDAIEITNP